MTRLYVALGLLFAADLAVVAWCLFEAEITERVAALLFDRFTAERQTGDAVAPATRPCPHTEGTERSAWQPQS